MQICFSSSADINNYTLLYANDTFLDKTSKNKKPRINESNLFHSLEKGTHVLRLSEMERIFKESDLKL